MSLGEEIQWEMAQILSDKAYQAVMMASMASVPSAHSYLLLPWLLWLDLGKRVNLLRALGGVTE